MELSFETYPCFVESCQTQVIYLHKGFSHYMREIVFHLIGDEENVLNTEPQYIMMVIIPVLVASFNKVNIFYSFTVKSLQCCPPVEYCVPCR